MSCGHSLFFEQSFTTLLFLLIQGNQNSSLNVGRNHLHSAHILQFQEPVIEIKWCLECALLPRLRFPLQMYRIFLTVREQRERRYNAMVEQMAGRAEEPV